MSREGSPAATALIGKPEPAIQLNGRVEIKSTLVAGTEIIALASVPG